MARKSKTVSSSREETLQPSSQLEVEDIRRALSDSDHRAIREKIDRAERSLDDVKSLIAHVPLLHNGKLSTGTIDYAAFRVETLSLIFEFAHQTLRKFASNPEAAHQQFLDDLGDEVGLTFARDLMGRLIKHNLLMPFQEMQKLLELWASFENDTGAGETKISQYTTEGITIILRNNPLRRAETIAHAHCGFYKSYIGSLVNEIFKIRARHIRSHVEGASVVAQNVFAIVEHHDVPEQCVFALRTRPEKLVRAFDQLTEAYDQFYKLQPSEDFAACMNKARSALVTAQMEAVGFSEEDRAPRQFHSVYKEQLGPQQFKRMDETYQRASKALHGESKTSRKMDRKYAWTVLRDVRKSVYALEQLSFDEPTKQRIRGEAKRLERIGAIEELIERAKDVPSGDRDEIRQLLAQIKKGDTLTEEHQKDLVGLLKKMGNKAWEVAKPILSDVLTAAIKSQLNLPPSSN